MERFKNWGLALLGLFGWVLAGVAYMLKQRLNKAEDAVAVAKAKEGIAIALDQQRRDDADVKEADAAVADAIAALERPGRE